MNYFLLKTEPDVYSYDDLVRDKKTEWDGVNNNLALKHIRTAQKGDLAIIYHTGKERRAMGIGQITSASYPDPELSEERRAVFDIKAKKKLKQPVELSELKAAAAFEDSPLVRMGRLSVVPLSAKQFKTLLKMAKTAL